MRRKPPLQAPAPRLPGALLLVALLLNACTTSLPSQSPGGTPPAAPPEVEDRSLPDQRGAAEPRSRGDASAPTLALLQQSERSADRGDLAGAIAYVERAIRLSPQDAELWLRLAGLQLSAEHPATAEGLAQKAIALAGDEVEQQRRGWMLVAAAREAQGDSAGAEQIRERWRTYRG